MTEIPRDLLESLAAWTLPPSLDQRCQGLMDRNTNGTLTQSEKEELEGFVALSEIISLLKARAMFLLGRPPT